MAVRTVRVWAQWVLAAMTVAMVGCDDSAPASDPSAALSPSDRAGAPPSHVAGTSQALIGGDEPRGRYYHASVWAPSLGTMLSFGGQAGYASYLNDSHVLTFTGDAGVWSPLEPEGTAPSPRSQHVAAWDDAHGRMLVFGGGMNDDFFNFDVDLHTLSYVDDTWTWAYQPVAGVHPRPRSGQASAWDEATSSMFLFGGRGSSYDDMINDVFMLSPDGFGWRWEELAPSGTKPTERTLASAVWDNETESLLVFGGYDAPFSKPADVFTLSREGDGWHWTRLTPSGPAPSVSSHSAVWDPLTRSMIVFGGAATALTNDVFVLSDDGGAWSWEHVQPGGALPDPTSGHTAVLEPTTGTMIAMGGTPDSVATTRLLQTSTLPWTWSDSLGPPRCLPPDAPIEPVTLLPASAPTGCESELMWNPPAGRETLPHVYDVELNGQRIGTTSETSFTLSGAHELLEGENTWRVRLLNCARGGPWSEVGTFDAALDAIAPPSAVTLTPVETIECANVDIAPFAASGGSSAARYALVVNGETIIDDAQADAEGAIAFNPRMYDLSLAPTNTWTVVARGCLGQETAAAQGTFDATSAVEATPAILRDATRARHCTEEFLWSGPSRFEGVTYDVLSEDQTITYAHDVRTHGWGFSFEDALPSGTHNVRVRTNNCIGETAVSEVYEHWIDNTPPEPSIYTPYRFAATGSPTSIRWSGSRAEAMQLRYRIEIDGVEVADVLGTDVMTSVGWFRVDVPGLSPGPHTAVVIAVACAGEETPSAPREFSVDNDGPSAPEITTPLEGEWLTLAPSPLEWTPATGGDGLAGYRVTLNGVDWPLVDTLRVDLPEHRTVTYDTFSYLDWTVGSGFWTGDQLETRSPYRSAADWHNPSGLQLGDSATAESNASFSVAYDLSVDAFPGRLDVLYRIDSGDWALLGSDAFPSYFRATHRRSYTTTAYAPGAPEVRFLSDAGGEDTDWVGIDNVVISWVDSIADGMHTVTVSAVDEIGNETQSATRTFGLDRVAPSVPSPLSPALAEHVSTDVPEFVWSESLDETSGMDTYILRVGDRTFDGLSPATPSYRPDVVLEEGRYEWFVTAIDRAGHTTVGPTSWFHIDRTRPAPPTLVSVSPRTPNDWVTSATPTFEFNAADDPDGSGVAYFELYVDGVPSAANPITASHCVAPTESAPAPNRCVTAPAPLAEGAHTWHVMAYDLAGNARFSTLNSFSVDTEPPLAFDHDTPHDDAVTTMPPSLCWDSASDAGSGVAAYWIAMEGSGLTPTTIVVDVPDEDTTTVCANAPESLTAGSYSWRVSAQDNAGNTRVANGGDPFTFTLQADTLAPTATIVEPMAEAVVSCGALAFSGTAFDPGAADGTGSGIRRVEVQIDATDDAGWVEAGLDPPMEPPVEPGTDSARWRYTWDAAATGEHTLYVRAVDASGNVQAAEERTFSVDCDGPAPFALATQSTTRDDGFVCDERTVTISWTATVDSDGGELADAPYQVWLDGEAFGERQSDTHATVTDLADGVHTWWVSAYDATGNRTDATAPNPGVSGALGTFTLDCTPPSISHATSFRLGASDTPALAHDTGLDVEVGERVRVWASGELCFTDDASCDPQHAGSGVCVDAAGRTTVAGISAAAPAYDALPLGAVVAWIGDSAHAPMLVGDTLEFVAETPGRMWMATNVSEPYPCASRWNEVAVQVGPGFHGQRPAHNTPLDTANPRFEWSDIEDAGVGGGSLILVIDGVALGDDALAADATSYSWPSDRSLSEGGHTWSLRATDALGNAAETTTWNFTIDRTPPRTFAIQSPVSSLDAPALVAATFALEWAETTDALTDVADYLVYLDGAYVSALPGDARAASEIPGPCASTGTGSRCALVGPLSDGPHTVQVYARDVLGPHDAARHETRSDVVSIVVDSVAPQAFELVRPIDGAYSNTLATEFCWATTEDAGSGVERYELLLGDAEPPLETVTVATLPDPERNAVVLCRVSTVSRGLHPWRVVAYDHAGNSTSSATYHVDVTADATPPTLTFLAPISGAHMREDFDVQVAATDGPHGTGIEDVRVFERGHYATASAATRDADTDVWTLTWPVDTEGDLTLCAAATDGAGNVSPIGGDTAACISLQVGRCLNVACDDQDPCTIDWCDAAAGCVAESAPTRLAACDYDGDAIDDALDNCVEISNLTQANVDGDAMGDACDDDLDGDEVLNLNDNCVEVSNTEQHDLDDDGEGDACDSDIDDDGLDNDDDNCPRHDNGGQEDSDSDGVGDLCDLCPAEPGEPNADGCPVSSGDAGGLADGGQDAPDTDASGETGDGETGDGETGDGGDNQAGDTGGCTCSTSPTKPSAPFAALVVLVGIMWRRSR